MPLALTHIRVVDRRASRRINGGPGRSHNLCFADATIFDVGYRDAKCLRAADLERWVTCPECRQALAASKART